MVEQKLTKPTGTIGNVGESMNIEGWKDKITTNDLKKNLRTITPDMIPQNFEGEAINYKGWKDKLEYELLQKLLKKGKGMFPDMGAGGY